MKQPVYSMLTEMASEPEAVDKSVAYVKSNMSRFLKKNEQVLVLYQKQDNAACRILDQAITQCGATAVWAGEDQRWMTLLKMAFTTKSSCIVGSPLTLLGLSKLAKHTGIPLYAKNVVMAGYPTTKWMVEGVRKNLDCMAWGCFDPGEGAVIGGFTCSQLDGAHIRTEEYTVEIVGEDGKNLPDGAFGRVILYPNKKPQLRFAVGDRGRLDRGICSCGNPAPKLVDVDTVKTGNEELSELGESLHCWSSILDCRLDRTEYGLELELVVFPGEKLPKLPTVAKQIIRPFDPEQDIPFAHHAQLKKRYLQ